MEDAGEGEPIVIRNIGLRRNNYDYYEFYDYVTGDRRKTAHNDCDCEAWHKDQGTLWVERDVGGTTTRRRV